MHVPSYASWLAIFKGEMMCATKSNTSELSEENGIVRKWVERDFGEKRLWGGWG